MLTEPPHQTHRAAKALITLITHPRTLWACRPTQLSVLSMTTTTKGFSEPCSLQQLNLGGTCFRPSASWRRSCRNPLRFLSGREASTPDLALSLPRAAHTCLQQQGLSWFQRGHTALQTPWKKPKDIPFPDSPTFHLLWIVDSGWKWPQTWVQLCINYIHQAESAQWGAPISHEPSERIEELTQKKQKLHLSKNLTGVLSMKKQVC